MLWKLVTVFIAIFGLCNSRHIEPNLEASIRSDDNYTGSSSPALEATQTTVDDGADSKHLLSSIDSKFENDVENVTLQSTIVNRNSPTDSATNNSHTANVSRSEEDTESISNTNLENLIEATPSPIATNEAQVLLERSEGNVSIVSTLISDEGSIEFRNLNLGNDGRSAVEDPVLSNLSGKLEAPNLSVDDTTIDSDHVQLFESVATIPANSSDSKANGYSRLEAVAKIDGIDVTLAPLNQERTTLLTHSFELPQTVTSKPDKSLPDRDDDLLGDYEPSETLGDLILNSENMNSSEKGIESFMKDSLTANSNEPADSTTSQPVKINIPADHIESEGSAEAVQSAEPEDALAIVESSNSMMTANTSTESNIQEFPILPTIPKPRSDQNEHIELNMFTEIAQQALSNPTTESVRPKDVQPPDQAIEDLIEQVIETLNAPKEVEELLEREIEESFNTLPKDDSRPISLDKPITKPSAEDNDKLGGSDTDNKMFSNEILHNLGFVNEAIASSNIQTVAEETVSPMIGKAVQNGKEHNSAYLSSVIVVGENKSSPAYSIEPIIENEGVNEDVKENTIHTVKKANPEILSTSEILDDYRITVGNSPSITAEKMVDSSIKQADRSIGSNHSIISIQDNLTVDEGSTEPHLPPLIRNSTYALVESKNIKASNVSNHDHEGAVVPLLQQQTTDTNLQEKEIGTVEELTTSASLEVKGIENSDTTTRSSVKMANHVETEKFPDAMSVTQSHASIFTMSQELLSPSPDSHSNKIKLHTALEKDAIPYGTSNILLQKNIPGQGVGQMNVGELQPLEDPMDFYSEKYKLNMPFDYDTPGRNLDLPEIGESLVRKDFNKPIFQGRSMLSEELIVPQSYEIKPSAFVPTKVEFDTVNLTVANPQEIPVKLATLETNYPINPNSSFTEVIVGATELTTILAFESDDEVTATRTQTLQASIGSRLVESRSLASDSATSYQNTASVNLAVIIFISVATLFLIVALLLVFGFKIRNRHGTLNIEMTDQQANVHISVPVATENR